MPNIKISRYAEPTQGEREAALAAMDGNTQDESPFPSDHFAGIIEPADRSWIIWLGKDGKPSHYYPVRDEASGAVMCEPILLADLPVIPA